MLRIWHGRGFENIKITNMHPFDPMRDPLGAGFHTLQSITAVGSGESLARVGYRNADSTSFHT